MKKNILVVATIAVVAVLLISSVLVLLSGQEWNEGTNTGIGELVVGTTAKIEKTTILDSGYTNFRGPMVHESLVRQNPEGDFVGCLAESWSTDDAKVWTFTWCTTPPGATASR